MKRKSSTEDDNAIGRALLWAAVMRLDRRIAMKILSVAIRERNRKITTPMKYHWTDGSEFRMSKFLQIKLHLACAIRGASIRFHIVGMLRTIFASC